jgi:hypothetical protein
MEKYKLKNGRIKKINNQLLIKCLILKLLMMMLKNSLCKYLDNKCLIWIQLIKNSSKLIHCSDENYYLIDYLYVIFLYRLNLL